MGAACVTQAPGSIKRISEETVAAAAGTSNQKAALLREEKPRCAIERWGLDLTDAGARKELFGRIGASPAKVMTLTEGVIGYLGVEEFASLADDLYASSRVSCG